MMDILIDNKSLSTYGITVLDYTGALSFPAERDDYLTWQDKSGIDPNLENIRYEPKEFALSLIVKADDEIAASDIVNEMVTDMFTRGVVVLSLRDSVRGLRECFLVKRSNTIVPTINIRYQNTLYVFKLGLLDINPNAIKYKTDVVGNSVTINYTKGQTSNIFWGDGTRGRVSNSGNYTKSDYVSDSDIDIIIDVDTTSDEVTPLEAIFSADVTSGVRAQTVVFTDASTGSPQTYAWSFGDGGTSEEANPTHVYEESGTFTVRLQVFNSASGNDVEEKVDYITVRPSELLINASGDRLLINVGGDKLLIN